MSGHQRLRLGDLLVAQQLISVDELEQALLQQRSSGNKLGKQLIEMGFVDESTLLTLLSEQLDVPFIDLSSYPFDQNLIQKIPEALARRNRVILLNESKDSYTLGMSDPSDIFIQDEIQDRLGKPLEINVILDSDLNNALDTYYSSADEISSLAEELDDTLGDDTLDLTSLTNQASDTDAPVVKLLQKIFEEAITTRASDIHIEPDELVLRIRQRIDGQLIEHVMNEKRIVNALIVRLKLMSNLDISEKRLPQDGRFNLKVKSRSIDVRLSTMPVQFGESVVMRILDHSRGVLPLDKVGMPTLYCDRFRDIIKKPHGLVLVTGPTGSGKTTTLYGALSELNIPERKIITVEDPVEFRLPRINQVQVHTKIGLDFSTVLRAALRQDPDVLLVGEIRDSQSAEIALRAAMTGHMVLSTLHTNDAIGAALRLVDMGVDPFLVASSLRAIVAQRLVRKICEHCSQPHTLSEDERHIIDSQKHKLSVSDLQFCKGKGCVHCYNTGYRGRIGVFEMLELTPELLDELRGNDVRNFNTLSKKQAGYKPLGLSALELAMQGITSFEEVMRVAAEIDTLEDSDIPLMQSETPHVEGSDNASI